MPNEHPLIFAMGFSEAAMLLRSPVGSSVRALISIAGEREHHVEGSFPHRLDLSFDDVAAPDPTDPIAAYHARMRRQEDAENGLIRRPPTREDAEKIIRFAESIRDLKGLVLCHCGGGISRAPAAALLCLAAWTGPGAESYCVEELQKSCPAALPHEDLVRFGDAILQRHGRLLAVLREKRPRLPTRP